MPRLTEELQFPELTGITKPKTGFSLYNSNGVLKIKHQDGSEQTIATVNMDDVDVNITFDEYYKKDQLYTRTEVDDLITYRLSTLESGFEVEILPTSTRPETGEEGKLYLIPVDGEDFYNEYLYVNGKWELIGSTVVDLSGYFDKKETTDEINKITNEKLDGYYNKTQVDEAVASSGKTIFRTWTEV